MEFYAKSWQPEKQKTACLVLAVFSDKHLLSPSTKRIDQATDGMIRDLLRKNDLAGKLKETLMLHHIADLPCERLLLVGCGKSSDFDNSAYQAAMSAAATALQASGAKDAHCSITECDVAANDLPWKITQAIININAALYSFNDYKAETQQKSSTSLRKITFILPSKMRNTKNIEQAIKQGAAVAGGMQLTRDLANTPANVCTPSYLAQAAKALAKQHKKVSSAALSTKEMKALKMNAFLAVAQGSAEAPKLITIEYRGANKKVSPIVFVGKGITFDTGGNSLKSPTNMIGMKYDMCGAATVLGIIKFAALLAIPLNIVGVIAAAENMPGGTACRPDDIVTTMSGRSVEILNTDAEGRLVLCDTLTYCKRFKPAAVIDIATLTGACVVALGRHHSGMYVNHQPLAELLSTAGQETNDKCWQMPLTPEYRQQLSSNFADIANIGGPEAGSITAASFLSYFTEDYNWAHLDVAGTACMFHGKEKGATGRPVPMLCQYLVNTANGHAV